MGEYIRLSKEDLKNGKDDSNSVKNQRDLLGDFYRRHMDEFESAVEYVDDRHTGTDANRENFQRLLADVVKDLSRFARNYSDAGSLIDNLFVQMDVRFISLAENVDSCLNPDSISNIIVPIGYTIVSYNVPLDPNHPLYPLACDRRVPGGVRALWADDPPRMLPCPTGKFRDHRWELTDGMDISQKNLWAVGGSGTMDLLNHAHQQIRRNAQCVQGERPFPS